MRIVVNPPYESFIAVVLPILTSVQSKTLWQISVLGSLPVLSSFMSFVMNSSYF